MLAPVTRGVVAGGDTYGSRWSRAKRETTGYRSRAYPTAAAVAEGVHDGSNLIRDPAGVDQSSVRGSGGCSLRSDHRLPYVTPPASFVGVAERHFSVAGPTFFRF